MKLYTMKCIKDPELLPEECGGMLGQKEYFVKLETEADAQHYNAAWDNDYESSTFGSDLEGELGILDENVYCYLGLNESIPAIGGTYTDADGLVWERVE